MDYNIPDNAEKSEKDVDDKGDPPDNLFPFLLAEITKHDDAETKTGSKSAKVTRMRDLNNFSRFGETE